MWAGLYRGKLKFRCSQPKLKLDCLRKPYLKICILTSVFGELDRSNDKQVLFKGFYVCFPYSSQREHMKYWYWVKGALKVVPEFSSKSKTFRNFANVQCWQPMTPILSTFHLHEKLKKILKIYFFSFHRNIRLNQKKCL